MCCIICPRPLKVALGELEPSMNARLEPRAMHLCFLLDLRSISPSLFRDLKQSLLQLANLYAASGGRGEDTLVLPDRIGLCYIQRNESSSSSSEAQLKIAYKPGGSFSLCDFHHAVNNLISFQTESSEHMPTDGDYQVEQSIRRILSDEFSCMWSAEDIVKKVIVTTTSVLTSSEALQKILIDADTNYTTVEFVVLEQAIMGNKSSSKSWRFMNSFEQVQNCVIHGHIADTWMLLGLVKRWLQDLRNEGVPLQALFIFKDAIWGSSNQVSCKLSASTDMIIDGFTSCQTCRCHGYPISYVCNKTKKNFCPVTCFKLGELDLIECAVRVGVKTVLFIPSFESSSKIQRISGPIMLNVIERTNLASLDEGVFMGTSYIVTPVCHEREASSDEHDRSEMNTQIFCGVCESLFYLDQGLVCSSSCNLETMTVGNFLSFYILQPSYNGPMLLRRLAGSEEILPISCQFKRSIVSEEIKSSIQSSLSKVELRDYNPVEHERGLHPQLNWLVKESLLFGSLPATVQMSPKLSTSPSCCHSSIPQKPPVILISEVENEGCPNPNQDDNAFSCISDEWEQLLIVDNMNDSFSAGSISVPKTENSTQNNAKPLDERTCRILERLEAPKSAPSISANVICGQMKKPLQPLLDSNSTQPLRPNFQRPKRKLR